MGLGPKLPSEPRQVPVGKAQSGRFYVIVDIGPEIVCHDESGTGQQRTDNGDNGGSGGILVPTLAQKQRGCLGRFRFGHQNSSKIIL